MCKIMVFTNVSRVQKISELVNTITPLITKRDRDGFGWAALGARGVFGERTTDINHEYQLNKLKLMVNGVPTKRKYEAFGRYSKLIGGAIFHGRTSTNDKTLVNTHPIRRDGWTLVHNGVVTHHGEQYKMTTTNDTEHIAYNMAVHGISGVEQNLTGYYAFGAIDPTGRLHVCRDRIASLYVARIKQIDSFVFATTRELIESVCDDMEWTHGLIEELQDDTYLIFNTDGSIAETRSIQSRGYGDRESRFASLSLGRELDSTEEQTRASFDWSSLESNDKLSDIDAFLNESKQVDDSYEIRNENGEPIDALEFRRMDDISKMRCTIIRPDGTVMDPDDYYTDRLPGVVNE